MKASRVVRRLLQTLALAALAFIFVDGVLLRLV